MMRRFRYTEPGEESTHRTVTLTEEEILREYRPYWVQQMIDKGLGYMVDEESCLDDWITSHWAWELKDGEE